MSLLKLFDLADNALHIGFCLGAVLKRFFKLDVVVIWVELYLSLLCLPWFIIWPWENLMESHLHFSY